MMEFVYETSVAVDSGQLSIADPCYWDSEKLAYEKLLDAWDKPGQEQSLLELGHLPASDANMAAVFTIPSGDGVYDVFSVWRNNEKIGMFVAFAEDVVTDA